MTIYFKPGQCAKEGDSAADRLGELTAIQCTGNISWLIDVPFHYYGPAIEDAGALL